MCLLSCRRQGVLTQGPARDPKCKLNMSSFLTLPHLPDCCICSRTSMALVFLLQMTREWDSWGWMIYNRVWEGRQEVGIIVQFLFLFLWVFFTCAFVLCSLVSSIPFLSDQSMIAVASVSLFFYFFSLSLVPLTRSYWCIEIVVSANCCVM